MSIFISYPVIVELLTCIATVSYSLVTCCSNFCCRIFKEAMVPESNRLRFTVEKPIHHNETEISTKYMITGIFFLTNKFKWSEVKSKSRSRNPSKTKNTNSCISVARIQINKTKTARAQEGFFSLGGKIPFA